MAEEHPLVQLARATIDRYVRTGRKLKPDEAPAQVVGGPAGTFVTIHTASTGELRGCIGTIEPNGGGAGAGSHQQRDFCGDPRPALPRP